MSEKLKVKQNLKEVKHHYKSIIKELESKIRKFENKIKELERLLLPKEPRKIRQRVAKVTQVEDGRRAALDKFKNFKKGTDVGNKKD